MSHYTERIVAPNSVAPECPAAQLVSEAVGGTGCVCGITRDLIDSRRNQSTLARHCFNREGYQSCLAWREDKKETWRTRTIRPLFNSKGDRTSGHPEDRERNDALAMAYEARERDQWLDRRALES